MNIIAKKLLNGPRRFRPGFSHILAFCGIFLGVFSLLVVVSVMNGFSKDMTRRVVGLQAEIIVSPTGNQPLIEPEKTLDAIRQAGFNAATLSQAELVLQRSTYLTAARCNGVEYSDFATVCPVLKPINNQENPDIATPEDEDFGLYVGLPNDSTFANNGIILGSELSYALGAVTVGEYVQVSSPIANRPSSFGLMPATRRLLVVGIFNSGLPEYDRSTAFIPTAVVNHLTGNKTGPQQIRVGSGNAFKSKQHAAQLSKLLGSNYQVEDWSVFNRSLFGAMKLEKNLMFVVISLMVLIAAFNLSGNFRRLVIEKQHEIGILKAMGASNNFVVNSFVQAASSLAAVGVAGGMFCAWLLLVVQQRWGLIRLNIPGFPFDNLPVQMRFSDFALAGIVAFALVFLVTLWPARSTRKLNPADLLRK